jgi:hypothetical protein
MPSCEKCWSDSRLAYDSVERYHELLRERNGRCTPEEQAGPDATMCEKCQRRTRHQHCGVCMSCGDAPVTKEG